jgi:hypothetical protein
MRFAKSLAGVAATVALIPAVAICQPAAQADAKAFLPDPASIPFTLPADIPWTGNPARSQQYKVMGDPAKPGPYILLLKWNPGAFSRPHIHEKTRYIAVISGTWWVSSSTQFDPAKTYPIPAGSLVRNEANLVHWDGARDAPVILQISGEGPVSTINVDEQGKPLPRAPRPE